MKSAAQQLIEFAKFEFPLVSQSFVDDDLPVIDQSIALV
jgi:hypothetical protein